MTQEEEWRREDEEWDRIIGKSKRPSAPDHPDIKSFKQEEPGNYIGQTQKEESVAPNTTRECESKNQNLEETDQQETTGKIQKKPMTENKSGANEIENTSENLPEKTILKTNNTDSNQNMNAEEKEIQLMDSTPQSSIVQQESLGSMRLVNSSLRHLEKLMKGVICSEIPPSERLYDVDRVQTACLCAKQITELLKVKMLLQETRRMNLKITTQLRGAHGVEQKQLTNVIARQEQKTTEK